MLKNFVMVVPVLVVIVAVVGGGQDVFLDALRVAPVLAVEIREGNKNIGTEAIEIPIDADGSINYKYSKQNQGNIREYIYKDKDHVEGEREAILHKNHNVDLNSKLDVRSNPNSVSSSFSSSFSSSRSF